MYILLVILFLNELLEHIGLRLDKWFFKITLFDGIYDARVYKTHPNFSRANQEKNLVKQIINIKCHEINIMNIINDNIFNRHNSRLNNDNRYMKVTLNS